MTTTHQPQPEAAARPQFAIETGRYYGDGSIDWLTPAVITAANCPADRTPRLFSVNLENYQSPRYGIYASGNGKFEAYAIKPGSYPMDIHLEFVQKDPATPSDTTPSGTVVVDLVVSGTALGSEFDREVLHHIHPGAEAEIAGLKAAVTAAQTAADTAGTAAAAAQKRADAAMADSGFNKETNDSQGNAIGQLTQRVLALEMEEAREATEEGEDSGD